MAEEPVTLKVVIYGHSYQIRYPSLWRVQELQEEYATMCKGSLRPRGIRKFFVCIHCGKDEFSNKMMLNRHRYVEGCPATRYADGAMALLLPYPDFKRGEGKRVEVLCKKTEALKKKPGGVDSLPDGEGIANVGGHAV